ncbi:integral membrane protein [Moniliophthora roreri MCA 2997]|uniref:Integral membrane protein n=1 Tax=Moniliophthora roreri (strain MCA 2997) TaxID=1381753 RepID=V2WIM1_MONRO|nr:integral membrane protein [Moniliophthora roreri MCA 2997]
MSTTPSKLKLRAWLDKLPSLPEDPTHPTQIALRTYSLALALSLGPSLLPIVTRLLTSDRNLHKTIKALKKVLRRELGFDGFAFAVTFAIWGGTALGKWWNEEFHINNYSGQYSPLKHVFLTFSSRLSAYQKSFLAYVLSSTVGFHLLLSGRRRSERLRAALTLAIPYTPPTSTPAAILGKASPTLDLTLLLLVRALDVLVQSFIQRQCGGLEVEEHQTIGENDLLMQFEEKMKTEEEKRKRISSLTTKIDAFAFWASSARIMWCFFYQPQRLPQSYVKWIGALASVDKRLLRTLRHVREGTWSYINGSKMHATELTTYAKDLGYPASWGSPTALPALGTNATGTWKDLGVVGRDRIGGLPCELVHGGEGKAFGLAGSCTANAGIRGIKAFMEALLIYLPAHILPVLISRPKSLLRLKRVVQTVLGACRSATFLSAFISSYWLAVCFTRTVALARLLPFISHDFWDGPYGCILAGCLTCGGSIWIENPRRRGEMALYVLPRAIRTYIPNRWVRSRTRVMTLESSAFVLSLASLLMAATYNPNCLRGISRWVLAFIMNGPSAGFWQRRRKAMTTQPGTPSLPINAVFSDIV